MHFVVCTVHLSICVRLSLCLEPLLGVTREQGEWPFRHKGAGSKGKISQGSREHENCNQGTGSTISVSEKAAERNLLTNLDLKTGLFPLISAATQQDGFFFQHLYREHVLKNQGAFKTIRKEQRARHALSRVLLGEYQSRNL